MEIRGILTDEGGSKAYNFLLSFGSPRMKGIYLRTVSSSQGIVTKSLAEVLTFQNITMNITERGVILVKSVNVSQNMLLMQKIAETWIAPVVDAIKNRHTTIEVLHQSEVYFRKYIRNILWRITEEVLFTMNQVFSFQDSGDDIEGDNIGDLVKFAGFVCHNFKNFHVAYYESVPELISDSSCGQYVFTHLFYMKFETKATSMSYPQVQYSGWKRITQGKDAEKIDHVISDGVPVKELSLKFEIETDKFGEPLSMTKRYKVNLKLEIDDASPERMIYLKMQEKLEKLMTEHYQDEINNLIFGSTTTYE